MTAGQPGWGEPGPSTARRETKKPQDTSPNSAYRFAMMTIGPSVVLLLFIGGVSGIASGLFGIGGGVLVVPALVYLAGFSQHRATGTSLAILLPPIGLAAVVEYYRHGIRRRVAS